jgi:hypothetical protein
MICNNERILFSFLLVFLQVNIIRPHKPNLVHEFFRIIRTNGKNYGAGEAGSLLNLLETLANM